MAEGPLGGPRPFSESKLQYKVRLVGPTGLDREEDGVFTSSGKSFRSQDSAIDKIGKVLMAVNRLARPSSYSIESFEIQSQGPGNGLSEGETEWVVTYTLSGSGGISDSLAKVTSATSMLKAHQVLIGGDDSPLSGSSTIQEFDIDDRLEVRSIQIMCG